MLLLTSAYLVILHRGHRGGTEARLRDAFEAYRIRAGGGPLPPVEIVDDEGLYRARAIDFVFVEHAVNGEPFGSFFPPILDFSNN